LPTLLILSAVDFLAFSRQNREAIANTRHREDPIAAPASRRRRVRQVML
jgi:hypothetical protein